MDKKIVEIVNGVDKNLLGILITSIIAFICWIVKGLIEVPINNSKEIFFKYFDKRIEVLGDIKIRLAIIALFPYEEGEPYKEQLQEFLLKDGKSAYLDSDIFAQILDISITPTTSEEKLSKAIKDVNLALSAYIGKVEQSNNFYSKYANVDPIKRISGYLLLSLYYILVIVALLLITGIAFYLFFLDSILIKILTSVSLFVIIILLNKWLNK